MKKHVLIFLGLLCIATLFSQETVNIFKSDLTVLNLSSSVVDSVKFSNNASQLVIYKSDNSFDGIEIPKIDSITFSGSVPAITPVLSTVAISSILNTTAKCSFSFLSTGGTSITEKGVCWSTAENPTIENNKVVSSTSTSATTVDVLGLTAQTSYFVRAYAINSSGISYSEQANFTTANFKPATVKTISVTYNYTTNKATCVVNISDNGGCTLTERGICWSTKRNPTIADTKFASGISTGQFFGLMSNLDLNAKYYVRGYATNCAGTSYGEELTVQPLMGNITYTLDLDKTAYPTQYKLIKTAMDSACWYFNRYTTFRGNIYVYYNAGIPTAQASYHGSIGFGSNTTYMWVGTAMHEMCHFVGSGTTTAWQNLTNGNWTGSVASALLVAETGETLKGDDMHFWPYGVNYKSEITNLGSPANQQKGLILCAKLCKAMCVDDAKLPSSW